MLHARSLVIGVLCTLGAVIPILYVRDNAQTATIRRLDRVVDSAKHVRAAAIESVTVYVPVVQAARAESDRLAGLVRVTSTTTLSVQLTPGSSVHVLEVPPVVAERIRTADSTIAAQAEIIARYERLAAADSGVIAPQDSLVAELKKGRRCGMKCGIVIGAGSALLLKLALALLL